MTMLLIMEALDSGQISLTDTVTASEAAAAKGGSQVYLKVGETMEALDSGQISLTDTVTASEAAAAKGGSQVYLKVGETMTVSDMLKSIAVSSANDCACAMAEHLAGSEEAFVERMNRRAQELGMTDTHFVNCTFP